jgi:hypothetical protein
MAPSPVISDLPLSRIAESPPSLLNAMLAGGGAILFANLFAAMFLTVTGISLYRMGWAFEIFLAAGVLSLLGWTLSLPWLLTPAILLMGNAVLLAYSALSGRWQDWGFLWTFEPLIIAASILLPLYLNRRKSEGVRLSRTGNLYLTLAALVLSTLTCWLAFVVSLFQ